MNEKWYKDFLLQKIQSEQYNDPTKILIVLALLESGELRLKNSLTQISRVVYRYYIANFDIAKTNINITIRNLKKYGIEDIRPIIIATINQWMREQVNGSFSIDKDYLYWHLESYDEVTREMTRKMCDMLYSKYYKKKLNPIVSLKHIADLNDRDMECFGKSELKQRVMEDYQYCPICEETDVENLRVVHILPSWETDNKTDLCDENNAILMCKEECLDYINGLFCFDELGRVINNGSKLVNNHMRLSIKILSEERKKYIIRHKKALFGNSNFNE